MQMPRGGITTMAMKGRVQNSQLIKTSQHLNCDCFDMISCSLSNYKSTQKPCKAATSNFLEGGLPIWK